VNNKSILSFISALLKDGAGVAEDTTVALTNKLQLVIDEIAKLAQAFTKLSTIVATHHEAIEQILAMQDFIVHNMKSTASSNTDATKLQQTRKEKTEKPN
jgi:hypothetical protein